ncbi:hypothetical protein [[Phormidium] sp. ETS-05]|uniref:hypothetical protein n=1 Tax=[Phormidium] sp. ETS-05 TaxID=222819 RepID=UPI0018EEE414|nr:hypothetical protein [[Phormidium] sp. ETS-05]
MKSLGWKLNSIDNTPVSELYPPFFAFLPFRAANGSTIERRRDIEAAPRRCLCL